ncbi:MAG: cytochrome-c peroxidase, partial [Myxococcaceae bacterium]
SFFEMSFDGRSFAKLGKKLVGMRGLSTQKVAPDDGVLGAYRDPSGRGIIPTYGELVRQAFVPALWDSEQVFSCTPNCSAQPNCDPGFVTIQPPLGQGGMLLREQFTMMQMNFSVFFGVAIQAYERTLISDDAPFDRYREGDSTALTDQQKHGLSLFSADARCISCHKGPDFTGAGFTLSQEELEGILIERMAMNDGGTALYDNGFYNIGVRPPSEDVGLGGTAPNGKPLSFVRRFVSGEFNEMNICNLQVPFASTNCFVLPPLDVRAAEDTVVDGTFKTPSLRNVELTGPYFHNGGQATLSQVVHFYNRGGDFTPQDESIRFIGLSEDEMADIVSFLKSLTDDRVRYEKAPFDHPELCIPDGHPANELPKNGSITATTLMLHVPAVGRNGGPALSSYEELLNGTGAKHTDGPCAPRGTP